MPLRFDKRTPTALAAIGWVLLTATASAQVPQSVSQSDKRVVAHSSAVSERGASLSFEFDDGSELTVALTRGLVMVDGNRAADYERGGSVELAWQALVAQAGSLDPAEMLEAAQGWTIDDLSGTDREAFGVIGSSLGTLQAPQGPLAVPIPPVPPIRVEALSTNRRVVRVAPLGQFRERLDDVGFELGPTNLIIGDFSIPRGQVIDNDVAVLRGDIDVQGHIRGNVVALDGDVLLQRGAVVEGDVLALNGEVIRGGGMVHGSIRSITDVGSGAGRQRQRVQTDAPTIGNIGTQLGGLLASFVALAGIGFGLVLVAPRQLETVADTVRGSFWRSFLAGVLAQSLVIPVAGLFMLGLVLTVVGIVLVPFAAVAMAVVTLLAVVGGYLATARSAGEAYLRRRMALGHAVGGWLSYRYVVYGLVMLLAVWAPAFLFGWIPVAGAIVTAFAVLFTWMMVTAGFGATIISRAGVHGTFVRRFDGVMTDQYLYHTPDSTPAIQRLPRRGGGA